MEVYLNKRTKDSTKATTKKKKSAEKKVSNEKEFNEEAEEFLQERKPFYTKIVDMIVGEPSSPQLSEDIEIIEEPATNAQKKGIFSALKGWLSPDFEMEDPEGEEEEVLVNEDLKDILKIQNKWLSKLPAEKMREFKESDDYKTYKDTLARYKLIKQQ